jgi:hypothetical protein
VKGLRVSIRLRRAALGDAESSLGDTGSPQAIDKFPLYPVPLSTATRLNNVPAEGETLTGGFTDGALRRMRKKVLKVALSGPLSNTGSDARRTLYAQVAASSRTP